MITGADRRDGGGGCEGSGGSALSGQGSRGSGLVTEELQDGCEVVAKFLNWRGADGGTVEEGLNEGWGQTFHPVGSGWMDGIC